MTVAQNLLQINEEIRQIVEKSPLSITAPRLIAVSKRQSDASIREAVDAGHRHFGENRWQEGFDHWHIYTEENTPPDLELHFIGPLQTNKVSEVVSFFHVLHSLDRPKLATALAKERDKQGQCPDCFIQVNTGEEPQKAGILPADAPAFIKECRAMELPIVGLMCIPPADVNPAPHFAFLRKMADEHGLQRLSMGMSSDWQAALRLGATDIRLGTAIFGERTG